MFSTNKSDFLRLSDVKSKTLYYEMMNYVLRNDESKIYMANISKPYFAQINGVFACCRKFCLNLGPQYPQSTHKPLSLSMMLNNYFFVYIN